MVRSVLLAAIVIVVGAVAVVRAMPPGDAESDRIADTVTNAISYPPKGSAINLARAARETGAVTVYAAEEPASPDPYNTVARLGLRVDYQVRDRFDFNPWEPRLLDRTACYEAEFGYPYVPDPRRVHCPDDTSPLPLPPRIPARTRQIPDGAADVVAAVLDTAPARPSADAVASATRDRLRSPGTDPTTGLPHLPPEVEADVRGGDVGIAGEGYERSCVLGSRVDGDVLVWRPTRIQMMPGELTCDPSTALYRHGTSPPH
jgi:hypothetical protein